MMDKLKKGSQKYMGIPLKIHVGDACYKHYTRDNKGVVYRCTDKLTMVKKCMLYRDEFFEDYNLIKEALEELPTFINLKDWFNLEEKMYMAEWVRDTKTLSRLNPRGRLDILQQIQGDLYKLFDEGYYWTGTWTEDVLITSDNQIRICDVDSIKPINVNTTFSEHYLWNWILE